ncbi:MAG: hypothetical protein LBD06_09840 [Candidatus Accumulibacter sp.]|nr:hypothetical protein [Accumulibacter sp.]
MRRQKTGRFGRFAPERGRKIGRSVSLSSVFYPLSSGTLVSCRVIGGGKREATDFS